MSDDAPPDMPPSESPPLLVPYDRDWRLRFEDEKGRLLARLGRWLRAVEHVGATAVVGLSARPIVDVLVALGSLEDATLIAPGLGGLGYAAATVHSDDGLQALERENPSGRYRLLLCTRTMKSYVRIMMFRDWLRNEPLGLLRYEKLREEKIAAGDEAYFAAKERFIAAAIDPLLPDTLRDGRQG
jgi:GrpB-like predicted nucleotidyltransferase (UPF0157 family)